MRKELGLGLYSLTGVYGPKDLGEIQAMLIYAVNHGVEYFDVADQYGPAEEVLGSTLKAYRPRIRISTKVGVTGDGFDLSYDYILKACRRSLMRLQTDYIDLYHVHFDDHATPVAETIGALEDLKKDGLILNYGLGHLSRERVKAYTEEGRPVSLMLELSPVAVRSYYELLPLCRDRDLRIIATGTTGRGLLTGKIRPDRVFEPHDIRSIDALFRRSMHQSARRVLAKLEDLAARMDKSPVQIAIAWILGLENVDIALVGPSNIAHLQENMGGAGWELPEPARRQLDAALAREEEWKRGAWAHDIQDILKGSLSEDRRSATADLVYVMEGLVELGMASQQEILPLFSKLMAWSRDKGPDATAHEIRAQLGDMLSRGPAHN